MHHIEYQPMQKTLQNLQNDLEYIIGQDMPFVLLFPLFMSLVWLSDRFILYFILGEAQTSWLNLAGMNRKSPSCWMLI